MYLKWWEWHFAKGTWKTAKLLSSFIKSHSKAKLLIKSKNIICAEKFDTFQRLSYFSMLGQDLKIIGFGKILRYKKI